MTHVDIPELRTARLRLRAFRADDLDDYAAVRAEPEVARYIGGPLSRPEAWDRMAVMVGQWALRGYGVFAIEERASPRAIGHVGILHPADWPEPEIAYTIGPAAWGRGYATEAARAVRAWAFDSYAFPRLVSFIVPSNARSIRVAEKLGAVRDGTVALRGVTADVWVHRRPNDA
jgi:RimJ/RimL family protein N-acetyltransferase